MSVEQRPPAGTSPTDELVATRGRSCSERTGDSAFTHSSSVGRTDRTTPAEPPLHARIERTQLRLQVAALERALETSERRRQTIIDRYEHLLAEREAAANESSTSEGRPESFLKRLLGLSH